MKIGEHARSAMTKKLFPEKVGDIIKKRINSVMHADMTVGNTHGK